MSKLLAGTKVRILRDFYDIPTPDDRIGYVCDSHENDGAIMISTVVLSSFNYETALAYEESTGEEIYEFMYIRNLEIV